MNSADGLTYGTGPPGGHPIFPSRPAGDPPTNPSTPLNQNANFSGGSVAQQVVQNLFEGIPNSSIPRTEQQIWRDSHPGYKLHNLTDGSQRAYVEGPNTFAFPNNPEYWEPFTPNQADYFGNAAARRDAFGNEFLRNAWEGGWANQDDRNALPFIGAYASGGAKRHLIGEAIGAGIGIATQAGIRGYRNYRAYRDYHEDVPLVRNYPLRGPHPNVAVRPPPRPGRPIPYDDIPEVINHGDNWVQYADGVMEGGGPYRHDIYERIMAGPRQIGPRGHVLPDMRVDAEYVFQGVHGMSDYRLAQRAQRVSRVSAAFRRETGDRTVPFDVRLNRIWRDESGVHPYVNDEP